MYTSDQVHRGEAAAGAVPPGPMIFMGPIDGRTEDSGGGVLKNLVKSWGGGSFTD